MNSSTDFVADYIPQPPESIAKLPPCDDHVIMMSFLGSICIIYVEMIILFNFTINQHNIT